MAMRSESRPLPPEFLSWQVGLRRQTMFEANGAPHVGVAPLVVVRQPGLALGVSVHSIICGLLPRPDLLAAKTREFRALYEDGISEGSRVVYDRGIAYLKSYYDSTADFDASSITTLLHRKLPLVDALRAEARCALVFYVFDLTNRSEEGRFRCLHLDCTAELLERGDVYFQHRASWDTRFGAFDSVSS